MDSSLEKEVDLPFIDLSQFSFDSEGIKNLQNHPGVATVRESCQEWGFFRIVNTGIPNDVFQKVESVSHELFAMPQEMKDRAITSSPHDTYINHPYRESFWFPTPPHSDSVLAFCNKLWPEKDNLKLCETIGAYILSMEDLKRKISSIIIASLELDKVETFYHSDFEKGTSVFRIHHYYSDGKFAAGEEALFAHTDPHCFTILYQDNGAGLQIQSKEGNWVHVKHIPNSLIINVADSLKAWSNGRYRSVNHRVVYKDWTNRISLGWFMMFPDKEIRVPAELIDDQHPQCYRPFTYLQFRDAFMTDRIDIDGYAGIIPTY